MFAKVTLPEGQLEELKEACQAPFNGNNDYMERSMKAMKGEPYVPKVQLKEFKTKNATMIVEPIVYGKKK
ncbi:hypothetical protein PIROE2DRAFT_15316 [Piromyces sp. E2]|nr:hypothetical protein PIROE2DRAFT_15316 [Piromyces sp. E2]|eukprot:OUM59221.1 hypothetical protein PIROE2DRAFT_15316 [Piromyces sp. E2]